MKTVLVTGAAGFIGRRMTVAAQAAGWHVIGLDRAAPAGPALNDQGPMPNVQCRHEDGERAPADGDRTAEDGGRIDHLSPLPTAKAGEAGCVPVGTQPDWLVADITKDEPIELPAGIDAIIHLAGKAHALAEVAQDVDEYFRINTEGTRRMLEAAQRAGVRAFVLFSTVKAAGDSGEDGRRMTEDGGEGRQTTDGGRRTAEDGGQRTEGGVTGERVTGNRSHGGGAVGRLSSVVCCPMDESCATPPDTPYGQSKRAAEKLVLEGGYVPHPVAIRPCLVYGPTPKGNLEKMIEAVKRGRFPPLPEVGNKRSMVHIDDVIAAALLAAEHPAAKGQIFIAGDNEPFSTRQLYEWICQAAGKKVPRWSVPLWVLRLLGRIGDLIGKLRGRRFVFDSDALAKLTGNAWYTSAKLQRELGWRPRHTLRETMPEVLRGAKPDVVNH